ncbi:MAG TPA: hypothetical protein VLG09_01780 [Candidatus Saccharimonadales bacterium]|nr:hypothetical protein [Candidatus Saccharimonadales bacterium]
MSAEIPTNNPEKKETLADNARKFITEKLSTEFLEEHNASSFMLTVDWLETDEDNEKKLAYKKFEDGDIQILLIAKTTQDGNRTSEKQKITEEEYREHLAHSKLHLEKKRYELEYVQNGIPFSLKYDEFGDEKDRILEVDASTEEERTAFNPSDFPSGLNEVTGDMQYYGYRVAEVI